MSKRFLYMTSYTHEIVWRETYPKLINRYGPDSFPKGAYELVIETCNFINRIEENHSLKKAKKHLNFLLHFCQNLIENYDPNLVPQILVANKLHSNKDLALCTKQLYELGFIKLELWQEIQNETLDISVILTLREGERINPIWLDAKHWGEKNKLDWEKRSELPE